MEDRPVQRTRAPKTDFNAQHLAEISDEQLPEQRREVLARAAEAQSVMLHLNGIGDTAWYRALKQQLAVNIARLDAMSEPRWRRVSFRIRR